MPGIVSARGSLRGVRQVLGDAVGRDPAGDPDTDADPQLLGRLVDVLADLALEGDRHEVVAVDPIDPDVVVVDELAQLGGDRHPDLALAGQPVEPAAELLDRLELSGPRRHPGDIGGERGPVGVIRELLERRDADDPRWTAADPAAAATGLGRCPVRTGQADRRAFGRGHEPLEVAEPVPSVAPGVDPEIAQPALIAPRPDGVRVDAEQSSRLGYGEGGIRRPFDEQRWQIFMRKCELTRPAYGTSQFLSIGRMYAPAGTTSAQSFGGRSAVRSAVTRT